MGSLSLFLGPCHRMVSQTNVSINLNGLSLWICRLCCKWAGGLLTICGGGQEGATLTHHRHYGNVKQQFNMLAVIQLGKCSASQLLKCQCTANWSWQVHKKNSEGKSYVPASDTKNLFCVTGDAENFIQVLHHDILFSTLLPTPSTCLCKRCVKPQELEIRIEQMYALFLWGLTAYIHSHSHSTLTSMASQTQKCPGQWALCKAQEQNPKSLQIQNPAVIPLCTCHVPWPLFLGREQIQRHSCFRNSLQSSHSLLGKGLPFSFSSLRYITYFLSVLSLTFLSTVIFILPLFPPLFTVGIPRGPE